MGNHPRRLEVLSGRSSWEGLYQSLLVGGGLIVPVVALPPMILLVRAVSGHPERYGLLAIVSSISGFALFSIAKVSVFRRGIWLSFGSSQMTTWNRAFYRLGYCLMIFAACIAVAIMSAAKWGLL